MLYLYSIIAGIIQGITEFLPISSSGHLVVLHNILQFSVGDSLAFDVALHLGTALAVIIYFWTYIKKYIIAVVSVFIPKQKYNKADLKDSLLIIYATIPAVIVGFLFDLYVKNLFRNIETVIVTLVIGAILFFLVEKLAKHYRDFTGMNIGKALFIGFAQAVALIPGVSRSGITIVAGMSMNLKRTEAAKFSFLLSIPAVLGAGALKMMGVAWTKLPAMELYSFALGFVVSLVVGVLVIKYFLKFLENHKLNVFAWYRIGLAVLLLIWVLI
jgi:undecaprenyl-diphosphatase